MSRIEAVEQGSRIKIEVIEQGVSSGKDVSTMVTVTDSIRPQHSVAVVEGHDKTSGGITAVYTLTPEGQLGLDFGDGGDDSKYSDFLNKAIPLGQAKMEHLRSSRGLFAENEKPVVETEEVKLQSLIALGEATVKKISTIRDDMSANKQDLERSNPFEQVRNNLEFANTVLGPALGDFLESTGFTAIYLAGDKDSGIKLQNHSFSVDLKNENSHPAVVVFGHRSSSRGSKLCSYEITDMENGAYGIYPYHPRASDIVEFGKMSFGKILNVVQIGVIEKIDQLEQVAANLPQSGL